MIDEKVMKSLGAYPLRGVRFNVIRRSAHKSIESMLKKVEDDRAAGRIGEWFARWKVDIGAADVAVFKRTCLDPVLENLCDDYEWWSWCMSARTTDDPTFGVFNGAVRRTQCPKHCPHHFRFPYGTHSPLADGGFGDVDSYLETGSTVGLRQCENLFPELA